MQPKSTSIEPKIQDRVGTNGEAALPKVGDRIRAQSLDGTKYFGIIFEIIEGDVATVDITHPIQERWEIRFSKFTVLKRPVAPSRSHATRTIVSICVG